MTEQRVIAFPETYYFADVTVDDIRGEVWHAYYDPYAPADQDGEMFEEIGTFASEHEARAACYKHFYQLVTPDLYAEVQRLREALRECEDYFDNRADAEYTPERAAPQGNEEMRMLGVVRAALGSR